MAESFSCRSKREKWTATSSLSAANSEKADTFTLAKLIVSRNLLRQRKGSPSLEEEEAMHACDNE